MVNFFKSKVTEPNFPSIDIFFLEITNKKYKYFEFIYFLLSLLF